MKLTHPVKKATDIVPEDNLHDTVSVCFDRRYNELHIQGFDIVGDFHKFTSESNYAVHFQSKAIYRFDYKLRKSVTHTWETTMSCNLINETYLCENIFMAARLIHTTMQEIQQFREKVMKITNKNIYPAKYFDILIQGVIERSNEPGGLVCMYKKDLRRGTAVKLQPTYFENISIACE